MPNIIRGKQPKRATGRTLAKDRARLDRIGLAEALGDVEYSLLAEREVEDSATGILTADRVHASTVIRFDLVPWICEHSAAVGHGGGCINRQLVQQIARGWVPTMARHLLIVRTIKRSIYWLRAEDGAIAAAPLDGRGSVTRALVYQSMARNRLEPVEALGLDFDLAWVFANVIASLEQC
jgi:hypothetical protein